MTAPPDDLAAARHLFAQPCHFVLAASIPEHFPDQDTALPEVAFWGRSNVGKSSLINALVGQKALARASNTPGRTQQIIFFNLAERLSLVDLPGYGHASAPKGSIAQWTGLIHRYLKTRSILGCVCMLIDSRRGLMPIDHEMMTMLDKLAISYQLVLTKADSMKPAQADALVATVNAALKKHPAARPVALLTSAEKKQGIAALQGMLAEYARN